MTTNNLRGLKEVRVHKDSLMSALQENRQEHAAVHREAQAGFVERTLELRSEMLEVEDMNEFRELAKKVVALPKPKEFLAEYDLAIKMVEVSEDDEFVLSDWEFKSFFLDEWAWKKEWKMSNSTYTG